MSAFNEDSLTVMNFNTFLLEVAAGGAQFAKKPNMKERAEGIAEWFSCLSPDELPDVLVLNEIMSSASEEMLRKLACKDWCKTRHKGGGDTFMACDADSKFEAITTVVNSTSWLNPVKEGGVVVLVKRGIAMLSAEEKVFSKSSGSDRMANKGFWAVKAQKGSQIYWVFATHTQAWPCAENTLIRREQFREMREHAMEVVQDEGRVCFAGDMNTSTHMYPAYEGIDPFESEEKDLMASLGGPHTPTTQGTFFPRGFWMKLDEDLEVSADVDCNHYLRCDADERKFGSQQFDWVIAPGTGDRFATPTAMRTQLLPLKADHYFPSEVLKGTFTDDLSDHYAVFAQLWYGPGPCPEVPQVEGHRGESGRLPCNLPQEVVDKLVEPISTNGGLQSFHDSQTKGGYFNRVILQKKVITVANCTDAVIKVGVQKDFFLDSYESQLAPTASIGWARSNAKEAWVTAGTSESKCVGVLEPGSTYEVHLAGTNEFCVRRPAQTPP